MMRWLAKFAGAKRGGVAMMFALAFPPLCIVGLGAIELNQVLADKRATQDVADAAALMGAQQLGVAPVGADSRAQAFAQSQLAQMSARSTVTVTATIVNDKTMKVAIDTHRNSFFGNMFPPGGFFTHAEATAAAANVTPLCVLIVGPDSKNDNVHLTASSNIQALQCLVHSNFAVTVDNNAVLQAYSTEAGTTASGSITPAASTGAPTLQDPFANASFPAPLPCVTPIPAQTNLSSGSTISAGTGTVGYDASGSGSSYTLQAGQHFGDITVEGGATLTLAPGEHYFCGKMEVKGGGKLVGNDAVMVFEPSGSINFGNNASVNLNGRKSGPLAGFVVIADRSYTTDFHIQSDPISNITGTIYIPSARLMVDGSSQGAAASAWTVLAAKSFNLNGSTQLVINANYTGSDVPVPYGVGNKRAPVRLAQ